MRAEPRSRYYEQALLTSINNRLERSLAGVESTQLRDALMHVTADGKRVRPMLCLLACGAAGGKELQALEAAVAIELLHCSSLVHDDIMDQAPLRRGKATLHTLYDVPTAILAGDTLMALAFRLMAPGAGEMKTEIRKIFSEAFLALCEGQSDDLFPARDLLERDDRHRLMVEKKTARLFSASSRIGALHATSNIHTVSALAECGRSLGMAFQAQDDLLDVVGLADETGKRTGIDAANGRRTFMTMGRDQSEQVSAVSSVIESYTRSARGALEGLPESAAKDSLVLLAGQLAERKS